MSEENNQSTKLEAPPNSLADDIPLATETDNTDGKTEENKVEEIEDISKDSKTPEDSASSEAPNVNVDKTAVEKPKSEVENILPSDTLDNVDNVQEIKEDSSEIAKTSTVDTPQESQPSDLQEVQDVTLEDIDASLNSVEEFVRNILFETIQKTLQTSQRKQSPTTSSESLYIELSERDQLTAFIEATLGALADDISIGEREYISHDEAYHWMTYFFLQFCGFQIFLANIDNWLVNGRDLNEIAQLIIELVDNVAENADFLHSDSDAPEHIAKNIIWQILNSNMMSRRYNDLGVSYWHAADILAEIVENAMEPKQQESVSRKSKIIISPPKMPSTYIDVNFEPEVCYEYEGIFNVTEYFISNLIEDSAYIIAKNRKPTESVTELAPKTDLQKSLSKEAYRLAESVKSMKSLGTVLKSTLTATPLRHRPVQYPRIDEFTPVIGKKFLNKLINKWKENLSEEWAFSIKFLMGQSDACSDYYIYEAKFGLPTPLYPVPQATCSLLFTIDVSRVKPPACSVNVSYKIEGSGYVYVPEDYVFQECWLLNVINSKLRLFSRVRF